MIKLKNQLAFDKVSGQMYVIVDHGSVFCNCEKVSDYKRTPNVYKVRTSDLHIYNLSFGW